VKPGSVFDSRVPLSVAQRLKTRILRKLDTTSLRKGSAGLDTLSTASTFSLKMQICLLSRHVVMQILSTKYKVSSVTQIVGCAEDFSPHRLRLCALHKLWPTGSRLPQCVHRAAMPQLQARAGDCQRRNSREGNAAERQEIAPASVQRVKVTLGVLLVHEVLTRELART
jgi:hypothetical protein